MPRLLLPIWSFIKIPLCAYLLLCAAIYMFQRALEYFPDARQFRSTEFGMAHPFEVIPVDLENGLTVNSWYVPPKTAHMPIIVFAHGNSGNFALRAFRIKPLLEAGYGVALVGYPGYDGNLGEPTEGGIMQSARGTIGHLVKVGIPAGRIVIHGESLGTTVAVRMATEFPVAGVSLEAPPASMADVLLVSYPFLPSRWPIYDKFDSLSRIKQIHASLLIIHGTGDTVVPFEQGKALFAAANEPKEALFIPGANHGYGLYTEEAKENCCSSTAALFTRSWLAPSSGHAHQARLRLPSASRGLLPARS